MRTQMTDARLDRQLRVPGWNQSALAQARVGVVGDADRLASLFVLSAAALGVNNLVLLAPGADEALMEVARRLNPELHLFRVEGFYTHPILDDLFVGADALADLSQYGLANKLVLNRAFRHDIPVVRGFCYERDGEQGLKVFSYRRGREWRELEEMVSPVNLPGDHFDDGILDMIVAGLVLEEATNLLMRGGVSDEIIRLRRPRLRREARDARALVVGAGALGNFVGLGLAYAGVQDITVIDPDAVDVTNLNRQVLFAGGIGRSKAEVLCERLTGMFGARARSQVAYFRRDTQVSPYEVVFDCVDNFETRIILSEKCRDEGKVLISGGTGVEAGQVVVYDPAGGGGTPAEILGLYELVDRKQIEGYERERAACAYRPEPSVIMVNQIIGALMVDAWRRLVAGQEPGNIFYDSRSDTKW
jgi:molybdopterin/thiamine biosynthesis adenylyltransferase